MPSISISKNKTSLPNSRKISVVYNLKYTNSEKAYKPIHTKHYEKNNTQKLFKNFLFDKWSIFLVHQCVHLVLSFVFFSKGNFMRTFWGKNFANFNSDTIVWFEMFSKILTTLRIHEHNGTKIPQMGHHWELKSINLRSGLTFLLLLTVLARCLYWYLAVERTNFLRLALFLAITHK